MKIDNEVCGVCLYCIEICTEKAIQKKAYTITIEPNCTNCGECVKICPLGAIYNEEDE